MKPIELPVFFHTDETASMIKLDIDCKISDNEIRPVTFYNIESISPYYDSLEDGMEYCKVYTASDYFIANITYKDLKQQVELD